MSGIYLWCRAWPWFRQEFPFKQFDELDGLELSAALAAAAQHWDQEHPGALAKERVSQARQREARLTGPAARSASSAPHEATPFELVAVLAGWANRPRGIPGAASLRVVPMERVTFYRVEGASLAKDVLAALRMRVHAVSFSVLTAIPGVRDRAMFGMGQAIVRYGAIAAGGLDKTTRVLVARALDDFRTSGSPDWAVGIAKEAAAIEKHSTDLALTGEQSKLRGEAAVSGFLPPRAIAEAYSVPLGPLKKRLERWRKQNLMAGGWIENADRTGREPRYLYDVSRVAAVIRGK